MKPKIYVDSIESLQNICHELIPISSQMGIEFTEYTGKTLRLQAPLANNINHQQSAFGGSLFSLAALAGWGIMQLKLNELNLDANTVVASGEVNYSLPVFDKLDCRCSLPDNWTTFVARLQNNLKASIAMTSVIGLEDEPAMTFDGRYVVSLRSNNSE